MEQKEPTAIVNNHQVSKVFASGFILASGFSLSVFGTFTAISDLSEKKKPIIPIASIVIGISMIYLSVKHFEEANIQYK